jgi:hypothetical protein
MKPPAETWAAWVYRAAMMVLGMFGMAHITWLHFDLAYGDWPASTAQQRIEALATLGLCGMALLGVQQVGLVARNLVRNLKIAGPGGVSVNVNSHEGIAE